jgi:hypothetical protein
MSHSQQLRHPRDRVKLDLIESYELLARRFPVLQAIVKYIGAMSELLLKKSL